MRNAELSPPCPAGAPGATWENDHCSRAIPDRLGNVTNQAFKEGATRMPERINENPFSGEKDYRDFVETLVDACPENGEFDRVLRRLGGFPSRRSDDDGQECRVAWKQAFEEFPEFIVRGKALQADYQGRYAKECGQEHELFVGDGDDTRLCKITVNGGYGARLGLYPADPELKERYFMAEVSEDPRVYILRWMILNSLLQFRTKLEGFILGEGRRRDYRIVVSQPVLEKGIPTEPEIEEFMGQYGFGRVGADAYFNRKTKILLGDLAPRNARLTGGVLTPFDAIAERVSDEVADWIERKWKETGAVE